MSEYAENHVLGFLTRITLEYSGGLLAHSLNTMIYAIKTNMIKQLEIWEIQMDKYGIIQYYKILCVWTLIMSSFFVSLHIICIVYYNLNV